MISDNFSMGDFESWLSWFSSSGLTLRLSLSSFDSASTVSFGISSSTALTLMLQLSSFFFSGSLSPFSFSLNIASFSLASEITGSFAEVFFSTSWTLGSESLASILSTASILSLLALDSTSFTGVIFSLVSFVLLLSSLLSSDDLEESESSSDELSDSSLSVGILISSISFFLSVDSFSIVSSFVV